MIYTITVNPAIDYIMHSEEIHLGEVNRLSGTAFLAGGKGINVSQILNQLECPNQAWGFLGDFTGDYLKKILSEKKINSAFTTISASTRVNVKIKGMQEETELNAAGPDLTASEIAAFQSNFSKLTQNDVVVMSGSLLPSLPTDFYQQLVKLVQAHQAQFVIDTTGQALLDTLSARPLVIKPNHHELADLYQTEFKNDQELLAAARNLQERGAQNVLVSMAGAGAYLITANAVYHSNAPKGTVINSVGAGDSMIAGFVGCYTKDQNPVRAFEYGLACGSATAFTEDIATRDQIEAIRPQIKIEQIS